MNKVKSFFARHKNKVIASASTVSALALTSGVSTFAYSPKPIPTSEGLSFEALGNLWEYAASMLIDVINIVANQPLMVAMVALSLIGIGVGLFKRLLA